MLAPPPFRHLASEAVLIGVLALALWPSIFTTAGHVDEYTFFSHAQRLLAGQVIYRDFFEFTGPFSSLLGAAVFAVVGPSSVALRAVQALAICLAGWLCARLGRRLGLGPWGAVLPALLLIVLFRYQAGWSSHWLILPAIAGALLAAVQGLGDDRPRDWLLAGLAWRSSWSDRACSPGAPCSWGPWSS